MHNKTLNNSTAGHAHPTEEKEKVRNTTETSSKGQSGPAGNPVETRRG